MKKSTHNRVTRMLELMNRKEAYFFEDKKGDLYWTYPKGGWSKPATIDGKTLEYVAEHDWEVEQHKNKKSEV